MNNVLRDITGWTARGDRIAIATVVGTKRSAPRPLGTKMAINEHGEVSGSVSGGCVEGAVVEVAEQVLRDGNPVLAHFGIADEEAWTVGLPCGGEIDVWIQLHAPGPFQDAALAGARVAEATLLEGTDAGAKLVITPDGQHGGSLGSDEADAEALEAAGELLWTGASARRGAIFIDVVAPPPRLLLIGGVDIAAALCTLARALGWQTYVIDPRARYATADRFPDAHGVLQLWPQQAFEQLGGIDPATAIVALTHDPKLDDAALIIALRSPAAFVGAMGSRRAQEARLQRLIEAGVAGEQLARLSGPVGLDLGASSPEETALSILAEVVAARHGNRGGRLADTHGPIHAVAA